MTEEKDPNEEMIMAFAAWRAAEDAVRVIEVQKKQAIENFDTSLRDHQLIEIEARLKVESVMKTNGVTEEILPGAQCDYKINFRTMPETVKIADETAVPPRFIKEEVKKSIKKKEILDHFKKLRDENENLPNWGSIERAEPKLQWELIKK